jgi:short-subunit dehydrogenase
VVHLAKLVLPGMVERDRGRVLVTSSVASATPNPFQASYGASKAFLRSWATALRHELADSRVTVTTLMPGPTDTAIFRGGPIETTPIANGHLDRPEDVARDAVDALLAGRAGVVTGPLLTKVQVVAASFLPDRLLASVTSLVTRPRT